MNAFSPALLAAASNASDPLRFLHTMRGPDFLVLYAVWFVILFAAVLILRHTGFDNGFTTLGGLTLFLGLGIARIAVGTAHGMHNWSYLIMMMIFGAIFFLARLEQVSGSDSSSNSWWSSCSTGGGCGSGGCGGGGCGGCGGS